MKRLAILVLLIGAMLGLAAQAPARALAPGAEVRVAAAMASMPDCMEQMNKAGPHKPCGCTRADCIAAMIGGGPLLTASDSAAGLSSPADKSLEPIAAHAIPLAGRNLGPEPDPPTILI